MLGDLSFRDFLFSIRLSYKLNVLRVSKVLAWDGFHEFCWNEPYLKIPSWLNFFSELFLLPKLSKIKRIITKFYT